MEKGEKRRESEAIGNDRIDTSKTVVMKLVAIHNRIEVEKWLTYNFIIAIMDVKDLTKVFSVRYKFNEILTLPDWSTSFAF